MSDRFETPSWDAEPDDLGSGKELADEAPGTSATDEDLDASRENVLDGWPVSDAPADEATSEPAETAEPNDIEAPAPARTGSAGCSTAARRSRLRLDGARAGRADGAAGLLGARRASRQESGVPSESSWPVSTVM